MSLDSLEEEVSEAPERLLDFATSATGAVSDFVGFSDGVGEVGALDVERREKG
ncbi:hypothetical protein [Bartonella massiliensis]|uniref:hypothetical protein n=1 Tax=Bartonella massiliensis TaxID=929795 RepID=UPI001FE462BE|nr:hypothetical protein [Bartonella massiliensis]